MSLNKPGSHLLLNCGKEVRLADVAERPKGFKPFSREKAEKALKAAAVRETCGDTGAVCMDGFSVVVPVSVGCLAVHNKC
jgi:hypothetical protein